MSQAVSRASGEGGAEEAQRAPVAAGEVEDALAPLLARLEHREPRAAQGQRAGGEVPVRRLRVHAVVRRRDARHVPRRRLPEVEQVGDPVAAVGVEIADARGAVGVEPRPRGVGHLADRGLRLEQRLERDSLGAGRELGRQQDAAGIELPAADLLKQFV